MGFKRFLGSLGIGGPEVDTILDNPVVAPGGTLTGQVHFKGGSTDFDIQHIALELVALVESEQGDTEQKGYVPFGRVIAGGGFPLAAGQTGAIPFQLPVPWEAPVNQMYGSPLGVRLGVRTELAVASAVDKGDMDAFSVTPLPVQEAILNAFVNLGFRFKGADLELGHIRGSAQQLPFYQEIEFYASPQFAGVMNELEVTFVTTPAGMEVILEADKRGGLFRAGGDVVHRYMVTHQDAGQRDWTAEAGSWVQAMADGHGGHGGHGLPHQGHHGGGFGGMAGGVAGGIAAGIIGGMVAGEIIDEIGDAFEGDDD